MRLDKTVQQNIVPILGRSQLTKSAPAEWTGQAGVFL